MALFGIININKPKGITSHDVVSRLRKILNIKQIGHTGTLDPMATGVLPICIGKATKLIQYLDDTKAYRAYIKLGIKTLSYDLESEIIKRIPVSFDINRVKEIVSEFQGEIIQKPPIYSAVHYKGKRLYEYARKNIEIPDIPERKVFIKNIEIVDVNDEKSENPTIVIDIDCSSGTYIRSIANDIGSKLGYGAVLSDLTRTKAGKFYLDNSYTIEKIKEIYQNNKTISFLTNPINVLDFNKINIEEPLLIKIKNGQCFSIKNIDNLEENEKLLLVYEGTIMAIAKFKDNKIFPTNVFI